MGHRRLLSAISVAVGVLVTAGLAAGCGTASRPNIAGAVGIFTGDIRVGGYSVTVSCTGRAAGTSPTVVLIAGSTEPLTTFRFIQYRLSAVTRVCSYDRLGVGTSSKPRAAQTLADTATLLHELVFKLHAAPHGVVLVGHSIGGQVAAQYASQYRASGQVKAVVLLDATPPSYVKKTQALIPPAARGIAGAVRSDSVRIATGDDPERLVVAGAPPPPVGNIPLIVVQHGRNIFAAVPTYGARLQQIWSAGQREWLRLSTKSQMVVARRSGHAIYLDQPELTLRLIEQALSDAA